MRRSLFVAAAAAAATLPAMSFATSTPVQASNGGSAWCTAGVASPLPSWVQVSAGGLAPSRLYSVFITAPNGQQMGDVTYANQLGNLTESALPANYPGTYSVTIAKYHGAQPVATCAAGAS